MSDKHTPGPWVVDTTVALGPYHIITQSEDVPQSRCVVCAFPEWRRKPSPEADRPRLEADAQLIAAAPDLLEACRDALSKIDPFVHDVETIEAAIAKAEG